MPRNMGGVAGRRGTIRLRLPLFRGTNPLVTGVSSYTAEYAPSPRRAGQEPPEATRDRPRGHVADRSAAGVPPGKTGGSRTHGTRRRCDPLLTMSRWRPRHRDIVLCAYWRAAAPAARVVGSPARPARGPSLPSRGLARPTPLPPPGTQEAGAGGPARGAHRGGRR